jgi:hypothetical protein
LNNVADAAGKPKISISCLPADIKLTDIVSTKTVNISPIVPGNPTSKIEKITVAQTLDRLKASCQRKKLVDRQRREIRFYKLTGCWGNPPSFYQEILAKQSAEIKELQQRHTVISMTCNPSGLPIP